MVGTRYGVRPHHQYCLPMRPRGTSDEAVYSACKGGLISHHQIDRTEAALKNVLLNAVCPVRTISAEMAAVRVRATSV